MANSLANRRVKVMAAILAAALVVPIGAYIYLRSPPPQSRPFRLCK